VQNYIKITEFSNASNEKKFFYRGKILLTVSIKLVANYGSAFVEANLYRMKRFATVFTDINSIADLNGRKLPIRNSPKTLLKQIDYFIENDDEELK
jgi:hypothetical protein